MFDIVKDIIGYSGTADIDVYILEICASLIIALTLTFIDLIYRVFRHFWR